MNARSGNKLKMASGPGRQTGAALIMLAVGLIAILAVAGLALDGGHVMLNKARLQNAVDAAALAGAKNMDETGNTDLARAEARSLFAQNAAAAGNGELGAAWGNSGINLTIQFSDTLRPFVPGAPDGPYVRAIATGFTLPAWLTQVIGRNQFTIRASAVAGPSPSLGDICNVAPVMVCGDPPPPAGTGSAPLWGYDYGQPVVLKTSTTNGNWEETPGPGNFQLIRVGGAGGAVVREAMAGSYDACLTNGDSVETEPGNTVGPVVQGMNTRFGKWLGPMGGTEGTYPPDVLTTQQNPPLTSDEFGNIFQGSTQVTQANAGDLLYTHSNYEADSADPSRYDFSPESDAPPTGVFGRRILVVPIGDCSTTTNGQGTVPVLGYGCFFLLQEAEQKGNESSIYGEFSRGCRVSGTAGPNPGAGPGPYLIQLYDDPDSRDS